MTDTAKSRTNLLAVYGTLRKGQGNYSYFLSDGVECVEEAGKVRGYCLRTFGGFPAAFEDSPDSAIVVDVFDISTYYDPDTLMDSIDGMEFGAGYDKEVVVTETGLEVMMYTMQPSEKDWMREEIPDGDWYTYIQERDYG